MEETDESQTQIEVPEENNVVANEYPSSGASIHVDSEEVPSDTLSQPLQPFIVPAED
jgi:hypothetical protein